MQSWRVVLAWEGAGFVGWQRQRNGLSIQQVVEEALQRILGGELVAVTASGRTDAGVHALAQVASFRAETIRSPDELRRGLNAELPASISCLDATPAADGFDARMWAEGKRYRYRLSQRRDRCPFRARYQWRVAPGLDISAMEQAMGLLVGTHDFTSFRASGCAARHAVRTIKTATLATPAGEFKDELHLDFVGDGFLRHQVRIMVGTVVEVGQGRRAPEDIGRLLGAHDRRLAGRTAPPNGLCLVEVFMGQGPQNNS